MKRTTALFLTTLISVSVYWIITAYMAMNEHSIGFMEALFAPPLETKIIIAGAIFLSGLLFSLIAASKPSQPTLANGSLATKEFQEAISVILFSPAPINVRVQKALALAEDALGLSSIIVGVYGKDKINIIAQTKAAETLMIDKDIKPYKSETQNHPIEKMIATCYTEKRDSLSAQIDEANKVINLALKTEHALRPFGILSAILPTHKSLTQVEETLLHFVVDSIAFAINITHKKDDVMQANVRFYQQHNEVDNDLGIYTNTKIQKVLEHEIRRHNRYHTSLSIILFEIDHFRNLCNIFSPKESEQIRKEFVSVIKNHIRDTDIFGKWVDQQFAIVIADLDFKSANTLATKLKEILQTKHFNKVGKLTCSFGVTSYSPKDTLGIFRQRVENALEAAKKNGGNRIEIKLLV